MSAITHAKVKFAQDKTIKSVSISDIVEFRSKVPVHKNDYDRNFLYTCIWKDSKNPSGVRLAVLVGGLESGQKEADELLEDRTSFPGISVSDLDEFSAATEEECELSQESILQKLTLQQRAVKMNMELASFVAAKRNLEQLKRSQPSLSQHSSDSEEDGPIPRKKQKPLRWTDSEDEDSDATKSNEVQKPLRSEDNSHQQEQNREDISDFPLDFSTHNSGLVSENTLNESQEVLKNTLGNSSDRMTQQASISQPNAVYENGPSTSAQNSLIQVETNNQKQLEQIDESQPVINNQKQQQEIEGNRDALNNQQEDIEDNLDAANNQQGEQQEFDFQNQFLHYNEEVISDDEGRQNNGRRKKVNYRLFRLKEIHELPALNPNDLTITYTLPDGGLDVEENGMSVYDTFDNDTKIYLGAGKAVDITTWQLMSADDKWIFLRGIAQVMWPKSRLVNRCFKKEKIQIILLNRSPRKQLTPSKHRAIRRLFSDYLENKGITGGIKDKIMTKMNRHIGYKIKEIRKNLYTEVFQYEDLPNDE